MTEQLLVGKGKRLRSTLLILCARHMGCAGERPRKLASLLELVHAASLCHDDVLDNGALRRGRLTANAVWGNRLAVLGGDFLLAKACVLLNEDGDQEIGRVVQGAIRETVEGAAREMTSAKRLGVTQEECLQIAAQKTGALFAAACEMGAIIGGAAASVRRAFAAYGLRFGLAFQVIDDALDYFGDAVSLGKPVGGDFKEGKATLPLLLALPACDASEYEWIKGRFGANELDDSQFRAVVELLERAGVKAALLSMAAEVVEKAIGSLAVLGESTERHLLERLARAILSRSR